MCPMDNISKITTVTDLKILQSKDMKRIRKWAKAQVKEEMGQEKLHVVLTHSFSKDC